MNEIGFNIPELIIESLLKDGLQNVRNDPTIIDSVFAQLTRTYNSRKYGAAEIAKIKALVQKEIAVLYSYHEVDAKTLSYSIMIGTDTEDKHRAQLSDFYESVSEPITNPVELQALKRVENIIVTNYNPQNGKVAIADSVNISNVYKGMIFVDADGIDHPILGSINNTIGEKSFFIQKNDDVNYSLNTSYIKSSLDYKEYEIAGVTGDVQLVIGAHSKDALTTKYLYLLLKYFILSRKPDLISRGLYVSSYSGSDFSRDAQYVGDHVFTRFLTITAKVDDTWRSDLVTLIDNVQVNPIPVE
jgi:hypothetical protein